MESTNSKNNNYREGQQQLQKSARKRKFNKLANESHGQAATVGGEQKEQQTPEKLSKKNCGGQQGNDAFEELQLESLPREELINLVRKQEAVKKEAEESAKQQAKEMATKMEDLQMAYLASQHEVKQLTEEMANSAKQYEEFSQRIVQLERKNAKVQAELGKKLVEIEEMHKELEEKSEELAEKAKQMNALLVKINESTRQDHQSGSPTEEEMKIQLSLETWYDWLAFVPRHQLGKIFLHEYREIMIGDIEIVAPYEDPSGNPRVRVLQNNSWLRFEMADTQMPTNIKNFKSFRLRLSMPQMSSPIHSLLMALSLPDYIFSYFDQSVHNFMRKFKQKGLLNNVNLWFDANLSPKDILQSVLCHLLPLINGIRSINLSDSAQLVDIYDAENSKEIYERNMKMMEKTRILVASYDRKNLNGNQIDLYCRWLYQPARADGKPRLLQFGRRDLDSAPISLFVDRLKQDFLMATPPVTFFIRIFLPKAFQPLDTICMDNDKTEERFQTVMEKVDQNWDILQISRHPQASTNKWIVSKEYYEKRIYLSKELKFVEI